VFGSTVNVAILKSFLLVATNCPESMFFSFFSVFQFNLQSRIGKKAANLQTKLYIPSTLNIDLILWHTQLIVCAENVKSWFKSWVFPFTFQAYIQPHTLNCICVILFKFHI
jgi:hypothetical protein